MGRLIAAVADVQPVHLLEPLDRGHRLWQVEARVSSQQVEAGAVDLDLVAEAAGAEDGRPLLQLPHARVLLLRGDGRDQVGRALRRRQPRERFEHARFALGRPVAEERRARHAV